MRLQKPPVWDLGVGGEEEVVGNGSVRGRGQAFDHTVGEGVAKRLHLAVCRGAKDYLAVKGGKLTLGQGEESTGPKGMGSRGDEAVRRGCGAGGGSLR